MTNSENKVEIKVGYYVNIEWWNTGTMDTFKGSFGMFETVSECEAIIEQFNEQLGEDEEVLDAGYRYARYVEENGKFFRLQAIEIPDWYKKTVPADKK